MISFVPKKKEQALGVGEKGRRKYGGGGAGRREEMRPFLRKSAATRSARTRFLVAKSRSQMPYCPSGLTLANWNTVGIQYYLHLGQGKFPPPFVTMTVPQGPNKDERLPPPDRKEWSVRNTYNTTLKT